MRIFDAHIYSLLLNTIYMGTKHTYIDMGTKHAYSLYAYKTRMYMRTKHAYICVQNTHISLRTKHAYICVPVNCLSHWRALPIRHKGF